MMYVIKHGDTLSQLAQRFGTTTTKLARDNNIDDPNKIYAGNIIVVPSDSAGILSLWESVKRLLWKPLW